MAQSFLFDAPPPPRRPALLSRLPHVEGTQARELRARAAIPGDAGSVSAGAGIGWTMKYSATGVAPWIGAYVVLALTPLLLGMVGPTPGPRPFLTEVGVGLGFVGTGLLALQLVITGRFRSIAPIFGGDVVLQFHRQIGVVAVIVILAHPVVLIASDTTFLEFFDPRVNLPRAVVLITVVPALILQLVTSLWRELVRLEYEWWRLAHGVLALLIVGIGMVHGLIVSQHLEPLWKQVLWVGSLSGLMYLVVHSRIVRPARLKRRPYRVAHVRQELSDVHTLVVEPVGHVGMNFLPGQYAWITVGSSPFSMQQHPFSFSSSAHSGELSFTVKALGDFTSSIADLERGQPVFLEGPYGAFTFDADSDGAVFVVGGIGVTPAMSILRTMRDTDDDRPVILVYANPDTDSIAFREELDELAEVLDLQVVHVVEDPGPDWEGEEGFVDRDVLERALPPDCRTYEYFVCGPEPLMDTVEEALRDMGVSWRQIYTERFQIV
jgi:predicted ferric reductase